MKRYNALLLAACALNTAYGNLEQGMEMLARAGEEKAIPELLDIARKARRAKETILLLLEAETDE